MLTYRQYRDFIMSEEQKIFLPGTESATIVSQAMVMATRMELLRPLSLRSCQAIQR